MENIGQYAFEFLNELKSLTLPSTIKYIDPEAFVTASGNPTHTQVGRINIPSLQFWLNFQKTGYIWLDYTLYSNDKPLVNLEIAHTVSDLLHDYAFAGSAITSLTLDEGFTGTGQFTFSGCRSLSEVILPSSLKEIGDGAFSGCWSLKEINIPEGTETIADVAFYYCKTLEAISFPSTLREIKDRFNYCNDLQKIEIRAINPPLVKEFYTPLYSQCTLYVPVESMELYRRDPIWGQFLTILTIDSETGIGNVSISETENSQPIIYDLYGRRVNHNDLKSGIYIINGKKTVITR